MGGGGGVILEVGHECQNSGISDNWENIVGLGTIDLKWDSHFSDDFVISIPPVLIFDAPLISTCYKVLLMSKMVKIRSGTEGVNNSGTWDY